MLYFVKIFGIIIFLTEKLVECFFSEMLAEVYRVTWLRISEKFLSQILCLNFRAS